MAKKQAPINTSVVERINDFSGGLNTTISPSLLNNYEAQKANDVSFEQKGTIIPRKGRKKRYAEPFNNYPCTGMAGYYKKDGTSRLVIASGDKLYSDEPHIDTKYTTQADFESGTKTSSLSTSKKSGSVVFDIIKSGADTATLDTQTDKFGVATYNYGWKFTPKANVTISNYKFKGVGVAAQYVITLYKVSDKSVVDTVTKTTTTGETDWLSIPTSKAVNLTRGAQYMIAIQCSVANGLYGYKTFTPESNIQYTSDGGYMLFSTPSGEILTPYPETTTTTYKVLGVIFDFEVTSMLKTYTSTDELISGFLDKCSVVSDSVILSTKKSALTKSYTTQADMQKGITTDTSTTIIAGSITLAKSI